ncbi:MAG: TonB-dependent receptor family protein [Chitinophagales bacterium]|jgi:Fe(3+) dicitrate transport protein
MNSLNNIIGNSGRASFVDLKELLMLFEVFFVKKLRVLTFMLCWMSTTTLIAQELDSLGVQRLQRVDIKAKAMISGRLRAVEGLAIYEGKKTELIQVDGLTANLATNNARQVFAKVAGLNIWESDGAGLQLGVGGRGLSPNRTSNFNTRQNGYDMSADALGYPESYYTPPVEALERIEVVRGAASLQYGTQFGGLLNFVIRQPGGDRPVHYLGRQTVGSFGFMNTFNSLRGTLQGGKVSYHTFFQHKRGDGWRENAGFALNNGYLDVHYQVSERFSVDVEYTGMGYLAQQPGGLTDAQFEQDPRISYRSRNWFQVQWNLAMVGAEYVFSDFTKVNIRNFALRAGRLALGNLSPVNNLDFGQNRDLIDGRFANQGSEARLLHRYSVKGLDQILLVGARAYKGTSFARQGEASNGSGADFQFLNPGDVEKSDYVFPNYNYALFAEHIVRFSPQFTITPGLRIERIETLAEGFYKQRVFDFAGNLISERRIEEVLNRDRSFLLLGAGVSWKPRRYQEWYANFSQNYRAINFTDLRIDNPNGRVDPAITDEQGYTADIGFRTRGHRWINADVTAFYMAYKDRIGLLLKADQPPLYNDYRLRTNIADSRNIGLESFVEVQLMPLLRPFDTLNQVSMFVNMAVVDARYIRTDDSSIRNKRVEQSPPLTFRSGMSYKRGHFRATANWSWTAEHFTDATNARRTASAVNGVIPSYSVMDLSLARAWRWWTLEISCNNLFDQRYFTRRAEAYPGPGIIPSDGRSIYLTLQVRL